MGEMVPWCRPGDHFGVYRVGLLTTQTKETFFSIPVSPTLLGFIFLKVVITMWYYFIWSIDCPSLPTTTLSVFHIAVFSGLKQCLILQWALNEWVEWMIIHNIKSQQAALENQSFHLQNVCQMSNLRVASEIFHSFFSSLISGWGRLRCVSQGTRSLLFHSSYFLTERELEARSSESQSSLALLGYLWLNLSVRKAILGYCQECNFRSP